MFGNVDRPRVVESEKVDTLTNSVQEDSSVSHSPRQIYLSRIGLKLDPFATPVAEQELAFSAYSIAGRRKEEGGQNTPSFFSYYCPPPIETPRGESLLRTLRQFRPAFIYGRPGMGKTTLRLILEADARLVPDYTLVVSYTLTEDIARPLTLDEHWERLARALAIDLFIQIVEQFNPLDPIPTDGQVASLRDLVAIGGPHLKQLIKRLLQESEPDPLLGLGRLWPALGRSAVRQVVSSESLFALLRKVLLRTGHFGESFPGRRGWSLGLETARQWGFRRVLVLIDGVDSRRRTEAEMFALIRPLLDQLPGWHSLNVTLKCFLPLELMAPVSAHLSGLDLPLSPFNVKIEWTEEGLRELLKGRFRAAGSRRLGLDDLAGPELERKLDSLILHSANGSPRRLLLIVSSLINAHIACNPTDQDPLISLTDWERMRAVWGGEPPPLPAANA